MVEIAEVYSSVYDQRTFACRVKTQVFHLHVAVDDSCRIVLRIEVEAVYVGIYMNGV